MALNKRLVEAAARSMPAMVMQKFHNLRGAAVVAHRFYEVVGTRDRRVVLTTDLQAIARSEQAHLLRAEVEARWAIVESSFEIGIGRSLIDEGMSIEGLVLLDKRRRKPVTGLRAAVNGLQHGFCMICGETLGELDPVAVDHVFPWSLMARGGVGGWSGPELDAVWNLAPAHEWCNGRKSNRPPSAVERRRLAERNEAIMGSPYPLRTTLLFTLRAARYTGKPGDWHHFVERVLAHL